MIPESGSFQTKPAKKALPSSSPTHSSASDRFHHTYIFYLLQHPTAIRHVKGNKTKQWVSFILDTLCSLSVPLMTLGPQMGNSGWVNDPKGKHKGHVGKRLKLTMEDLSCPFGLTIINFPSKTKMFCRGTVCSPIQCITAAVIFGCPLIRYQW